jgi:hypothetical protein
MRENWRRLCRRRATRCTSASVLLNSRRSNCEWSRIRQPELSSPPRCSGTGLFTQRNRPAQRAVLQTMASHSLSDAAVQRCRRSHARGFLREPHQQFPRGAAIVRRQPQRRGRSTRHQRCAASAACGSHSDAEIHVPDPTPCLRSSTLRWKYLRVVMQRWTMLTALR